MKICVILSGQNRFSKETSLAINKFLPYDTYCHFWDNNDNFVSNLQHLKKFTTSNFSKNDFTKSNHPSLEPMFYSLKLAYSSIEEPYDIYIRYRPDLLPINFLSIHELNRTVHENVLYSGFYGDDMKSGFLDRDIGLYEGTNLNWVSDMFWFCNFEISKIIFKSYDFLDYVPLICPELLLGFICERHNIKYAKSNFKTLFMDKISKNEFLCKYTDLTSKIIIKKHDSHLT